jgi:hypothetical protein
MPNTLAPLQYASHGDECRKKFLQLTTTIAVLGAIAAASHWPFTAEPTFHAAGRQILDESGGLQREGREGGSLSGVRDACGGRPSRQQVIAMAG